MLSGGLDHIEGVPASTQIPVNPNNLGMHESAMIGDAYKAAIYADAMHGDPNATFYGGLSPETFKNAGIAAEEAQGVGKNVADQVSGINIDGAAIAEKVSGALSSRSSHGQMLDWAGGAIGANPGRHGLGVAPESVDQGSLFNQGVGNAQEAVRDGQHEASVIANQNQVLSRSYNKEDFESPAYKISGFSANDFALGSKNQEGQALNVLFDMYKQKGLNDDQSLALAVSGIVNNDNSSQRPYTKTAIGEEDMLRVQEFIKTDYGKEFINFYGGVDGAMRLDRAIMEKPPRTSIDQPKSIE